MEGQIAVEDGRMDGACAPNEDGVEEMPYTKEREARQENHAPKPNKVGWRRSVR